MVIQTNDGIATIKGLEGVFANVISVVIGLAGIVLFIMIVLGGFKLLTSAGNPQSVEGAKKTLTYAIFGIALVGGSLFFLWILSQITGFNLFTFRVGF